MNSTIRTWRRKRHPYTPIVHIVFATLLMGCEHIDLAEQDGNGNTETPHVAPPLATGAGTIEAPYTVADILQGADTLAGHTIWVAGYAVGQSYKSLNNATFSTPFSYDTNILIADNPHCNKTYLCIPVELSTKVQKANISLSVNPQRHKHSIMLRATVQKYLNTTGLRTIQQYQWLGTYTIPNSSPTEWDEEEYIY